jgi:hypothetical protein
MKSLTTFLATALVLFAFGQAIAARGAEIGWNQPSVEGLSAG